MFAASGVFLIAVAGVLLFGLAALITRSKTRFFWPFLSLALLCVVAAVWGWTR
jgi:hypothetical protein